MRFHVASLPHTHTTEEFVACAFTEKVRKFCNMMMSLGHEVFLYGGEKNEANCTEHIVCIGDELRLQHIGAKHFSEAPWDPQLPAWVTFNSNTISGIMKRTQPRDFVCLIGGIAHKPIADALPNMMSVEFGIGYGGMFAKYRVWESHAWQHLCYGTLANHHNPNAIDGHFYDAVIPNYFEVKNFPFREKKDDYFLFIGRLIERKGFSIAVDVCKHLGAKLVIAGQGTPPDYGEYVGVVDAKRRGELMSGACAVFVPTTYIEPFGGVAVEAQLCGTPVISTPWGAMTETVEHGVTGFHCHTLQEFMDAARGVDKLDPHYIRARAVSKYSTEHVALLYDTYFKRLLTLYGRGWYELRQGDDNAARSV